MGFLRVRPYPAIARFKFGDGRVGEVKYAADIKVGTAGCRGAFTAVALETGIPALLRKGAIESLGGRSDFERDILTIRNRGAGNSLKVNEMGRYVVCVVAFSKGP